MKQPALIDAVEVANELGCCAKTVRNLDQTERIPASTKLGQLRRWNRQEIADWLAVGCPDRAQWERIKAERQQLNPAT